MSRLLGEPVGGGGWGSFWEPLGVILGTFGGPLGALGRSWVDFLKGRLSDPKCLFTVAPFLEPKGPKWRQKGPNGNLWARLGSLEMATWAFWPPKMAFEKKNDVTSGGPWGPMWVSLGKNESR